LWHPGAHPLQKGEIVPHGNETVCLPFIRLKILHVIQLVKDKDLLLFIGGAYTFDGYSIR